MDYHSTSYIAHAPDANGYIQYTPAEAQVWKTLIDRQLEIVKTRACDEFLEGLKILNLSREHVPQCREVSKKLKKTTGWEVVPVAAVISDKKFFNLLKNRQFPAASFVRRQDELDYLREPDLFHELFGHCPLLTYKPYADYMQKYGEIATQCTRPESRLLARLYWFTVEFGLIETSKGTQIYGGGILSSKQETIDAFDARATKCKPFSPLEALRTPYRIDILQPTYFVIKDFQDLYQLLDIDLVGVVRQAIELGDYPPAF